MKFVVRGRVWKLGDDVDTDLIVPGPYITIRDMDLLASHVLEEFIPNFAENVKPGDIIVAGKNFGCGSSREIAPALLKHLRLGAVVAESFARIFFRNAINLGLPLMECKGISRRVKQDQQLEVNIVLGEVRNLSTGETYKGTKLPDFLLEIIEAGGALEALKRKMAK
ncbi:MAG: 3-isopropylmalate dehydratase small subunit [Candidatus Bathyarchaeia archaeon]